MAIGSRPAPVTKADLIKITPKPINELLPFHVKDDRPIHPLFRGHALAPVDAYPPKRPIIIKPQPSGDFIEPI